MTSKSRLGILMPPRVDLTGQIFGMLTVVSWGHKGKWICKCSCGNETRVQGYPMKMGLTRSCGCIKPIISREKELRHGMADTRVHRSWMSMRQRCLNPNDRAYRHYGGRGITICERWEIFENFYADMGPMPDDMTLDRIRVNGNYEPSNCQWATYKQQARNNRRNVLHTYNGETKCSSEWAEQFGIQRTTFEYRVKNICADIEVTSSPCDLVHGTPLKQRAAAS